MSQYMKSALAQISKNHHNYVMMIIIWGLFFFFFNKKISSLNIFLLTFQMRSLSSLFLLCAHRTLFCMDSLHWLPHPLALGCFIQWGHWKAFCRRKECMVWVLLPSALQGYLVLERRPQLLSDNSFFLQAMEPVPFPCASGRGVGRHSH